MSVHAMRLALAVLAVAMTATGCGGSAGSRGPEVATAGSPGPTPSASAPAKESDYDKALRFTRCMTENGIPIEDPVEGEHLIRPKGPVKSAGGFSWIDVTGEVFDKCRRHLPATWPVKMDPADIARDRPFGECMRKHGIEWPEPDADGMVHYPADPSVPASPEYRAAEDACRHLIDDPAVRQ